MRQYRFCVVDYLVFYTFLLILIMVDNVRVYAIYLSTFAVCAILVFTHVVLRISCSLCAYRCCCHAWRRRRRQRREEESQRVKDVIQRAKSAYLESMTDD